MNDSKVRMCEQRIQQISSLLKFLRSKNFEVHNAHEREEWGSNWYTPEACTTLDFETIRSSDLLIAIPGNPASGGVHIELGWASALGKSVILLLDKAYTYSSLVEGLKQITSVKYIRYDEFNEITGELTKFLDINRVPNLQSHNSSIKVTEKQAV